MSDRRFLVSLLPDRVISRFGTSRGEERYRGLLSRGLKGCHVDFTNDRTRDLVESSVDRLAAELAVEHDPATKESGHE